MPFCPSCGAELKPGKNFCSNCGSATGPSGSPAALLSEPGPVPAGAGAPQPVPAQGLSLDRIIIAVVMGLAILGIVIFIGLPLLPPQGPATGTSNLPVTGATRSASAAGTVAPPVPAMPHGTGTDSSVGSTVYRNGVAYDQVFSRDYQQDEHGVQDAFSYNLGKAPMLVECEMNPVIISREQLVDIDTPNERYITSTYPDPNAWLDLKVINADTGHEVNTISFSKNYRGELKQTYPVLANGNYRFELTGVRVSPSVRLLVKQ